MLLAASLNHEYAGIDGVPEFLQHSLKFAYGSKEMGSESEALESGRVGGVQTISGTGALRIGGEFLARFRGKGTPFYLPNPTWANHIPIFKDAGLDVRSYSYYDADTRGLNFKGMLDDCHAAPTGSAFLLHACAHNPTGVDPTKEQWGEVSEVMKAKGHVVFFDCAYQGFATGDAEVDGFAVRKFAEDGHTMLLSQSYSKNFGLYGQRVGCLSAVTASPEETAKVVSQLKILVRPMYSNPPVHGARLVAKVLGDPNLRKEWERDCLGMAERITGMRAALVHALAQTGTTQPWEHITSQIGMFCYSGLSKEQVLAIRDKHSVYLTLDGRVSMAGVTSKNVEYLAQAMHDVTK